MNDEETFSWRLQQALPDYDVTNLAIPGYGSVHRPVQLQKALKMELRKPEVAVFAYSDVHLERNVAAPSRLRAYNEMTSFMDTRMRHLKARLDDDSNLIVELVSFVLPEGEKDPPVGEQIRVTQAIFDEIFSVCRESNITPVLAVIETQFSGEQEIGGGGKMEDEVVAHCLELGYSFVDMLVNFHGFWENRLYNCQPHDGHPSGEAHRIYADRLLAHLRLLM